MENYLMINGVKIELTPEQLEKVSQSVKNTTPKWEDFGTLDGYYVSNISSVEKYGLYSNNQNKNIFPTKEEAEACLALSQLCQWRNKYNEGWKPDWSDGSKKYIIFFDDKGKIITGVNQTVSKVLSFKSEKIRDKFVKDFEDLIYQAKPLLQ